MKHALKMVRRERAGLSLVLGGSMIAVSLLVMAAPGYAGSAPASAKTAGRLPAKPAVIAGTSAGTITGRVVFTGDAPVRKKLLRDSDPVCAATEQFNEDVVVTDGGLRDVLVRVVNPPAFDPASVSKQVIINQTKCMYEPRVVGVTVGQALAVQNGDPTFHNVRATLADKQLWNSAHPKAAPAIVKENVGQAGDVVELHCDVHPWMHAYAYVQASPYFAVTGDDGTFSIAGLPPGKYKLEAVHPLLGTKTASLTIGKGARAKVKTSFAFAAK